MHNHNFSLTELDDMIPWEKEIYTSMLINQINEENSKRENRQMQ
jgi:hypothetical protein